MKVANQHVVLVGMMGAGKTTVGRLLAARLGWEFWDNDEALQKATGETAAQLQAQRGRAVLHETENRLLREALGASTQTVYAAAGSVVLRPQLVRDALTIWLRISPAAEASNIARSGQHHRPLPADAATMLERLGKERESGYARLANVTVEVAPEAEVTCERVMRALQAITQSA
jgi:shikimate kinase